MADKDKKAKLKTVKSWEKQLNIKLEYQLNGSNVVKLWCVVCKKWESRIKASKNFNDAWIHHGTELIKKDTLKSHVTSKQHMKAVYHQKKKLVRSFCICGKCNKHYSYWTWFTTYVFTG